MLVEYLPDLGNYKWGVPRAWVQNVVLRGDRPMLMELLANGDKFSFLSNNSQKVWYFYKDILFFRINQYPDCVT